MYRKYLNIGDRFGSREIIGVLAERKNGYVIYKVRCDCGDVINLNGSYLRTKNRPCKSCSAKKNTKKGKDHYAYKHGASCRTKGKDRIYSIWVSMRQRCNDVNNAQYADYGGRGIKVDSSWDDFSVFLKDMGERPVGMQLERIDNNGNYEKKNCLWASRKTQANNRRSTRYHKVLGENVKHSEVLRVLKMSRDQFKYWSKKMGIEWIMKAYIDKLNKEKKIALEFIEASQDNDRNIEIELWD